MIGVEPNRNMHDPLRAKADEHDVDLEIRTVRGERIDVDDATADGVVGTLVLCGVDDPDGVVAEIRRILKPGATYFYLEHVAADPGTNLPARPELPDADAPVAGQRVRDQSVTRPRSSKLLASPRSIIRLSTLGCGAPTPGPN